MDPELLRLLLEILRNQNTTGSAAVGGDSPAGDSAVGGLIGFEPPPEPNSNDSPYNYMLEPQMGTGTGGDASVGGVLASDLESHASDYSDLLRSIANRTALFGGSSIGAGNGQTIGGQTAFQPTGTTANGAETIGGRSTFGGDLIQPPYSSSIARDTGASGVQYTAGYGVPYTYEDGSTGYRGGPPPPGMEVQPQHSPWPNEGEPTDPDVLNRAMVALARAHSFAQGGGSPALALSGLFGGGSTVSKPRSKEFSDEFVRSRPYRSTPQPNAVQRSNPQPQRQYSAPAPQRQAAFTPAPASRVAAQATIANALNTLRSLNRR